jgi:transcriptional regulator with XRE-family HTH domain
MRRSYPPDRRKQQTPLGTFIKKARLAANLTQAQLAWQLEISRPFLSQLERGEYLQPSPSILQNIATVLDISIEDLYAMTGYTLPSGLPEYPAYLHAKHPELPVEAVQELVNFFDFIRQKYHVAEQPSEPPPRHKK